MTGHRAGPTLFFALQSSSIARGRHGVTCVARVVARRHPCLRLRRPSASTVFENAFALRGQIRDDIAALPNASIHVWYEQGAESQLPVQGVFPGTMNPSQVRLPDNALYHLCGPVPFMHKIRSALIELGIPARDTQYEVFGPDLWQADFRIGRRSSSCGAEGSLTFAELRALVKPRSRSAARRAFAQHCGRRPGSISGAVWFLPAAPGTPSRRGEGT